MKNPIFSNASVVVLLIGIVLSPVAGVVTNAGGWGGAAWFTGVFVVGITLTTITAFLLAVIGKLRKEPTTIGSVIVLLWCLLFVVLAIIFYLKMGYI